MNFDPSWIDSELQYIIYDTATTISDWIGNPANTNLMSWDFRWGSYFATQLVFFTGLGCGIAWEVIAASIMYSYRKLHDVLGSVGSEGI